MGPLQFSNRCSDIAAGMATLVGLLLAGCMVAPSPAEAGGESPKPGLVGLLPDVARVDAAVPAPASVIGHEIGDGAVRYAPLVRYLQALADASPLVTLTPYAESHEGRTLYYLTITSAQNHARLADIKADNAKLADPRKLATAAQAEGLIRALPGVAWLAYGIHGDELSSTDAALVVAYQLAAGTDPQSRRLRDALVIHVDPLMNPDGRERYLQQLQQLTGKQPNPDYQAMQHRGLWSAGRGNHYLFDLNRDWLMLAHPETRGRAAQLLDWNPHLLVDAHEMGSLDTYLFDPPREPFNTSLSQQNMTWRRRFSADQAAAFDRHGWSYYTREWYEEWYAGYTNAWASLRGAVGLLYEQAGVNAAAVKQRSGTTLTYREAVHHQVVSSLTNLESLRANRPAVLGDYFKGRQEAISEKTRQFFLIPPAADQRRVQRLVNLLKRQGVEVFVAKQPFEAAKVTDVWGSRQERSRFPQGTFVVPSSQPERRLLRAFLEFDPHMPEKFLLEERTELENRRSSRIYDVTSWNLGMAYGLECAWCERVANAQLAPAEPPADAGPQRPRPAGYGTLIDGSSSDIYRVIARLLERGCRVRVATKSFTLADREYAPGTILLRNHENAADLSAQIQAATRDLNVAVLAAETALSTAGPDLGGRRFRLLEEPRIAIATQWPISTTSFGASWFLLDVRSEVRTSPVNVQNMGSMDLRKYNVLVLPHAWRPEALQSVLGPQVREKLRRWVESGGTLIAMGGSAAFLASKDQALGSVRLKRDVLDQLAVYEEQLQRERRARAISIDPQTIWAVPAAPQAPTEEPKLGEAQVNEPAPAKPKTDVDKLQRRDAWQRMFAPRGVFAAAWLDREHWMCFGLGEKLPVLIAGEYAFMSQHPVKTPARLASLEELRLSGLMWPEARQRWSDSAYATTERLGDGQIILFAFDPFFRGYLEGSGRLFLNAMLLGPGLGTSRPVPW